MKFEFSRNAENDLVSLQESLQKRILNKLEFFEKSNNPLTFAKQLKGTLNRFSFRVGDYRIIVAKQEKGTYVILVILKIGHRREVYDKL